MMTAGDRGSGGEDKKEVVVNSAEKWGSSGSSRVGCSGSDAVASWLAVVVGSAVWVAVASSLTTASSRKTTVHPLGHLGRLAARDVIRYKVFSGMLLYDSTREDGWGQGLGCYCSS